MVLAPVIARVTHETAATAAASIHLHYEGAVVETPLAAFTGFADLVGVAVLAPEQGLVEWFPGADQPLGRLAGCAAEAVGAGWRVSLLVPAGRMGEAHRALRGLDVRLQPWWADGDTVSFGGPEVP